jgi:hypothetical protein
MSHNKKTINSEYTDNSYDDMKYMLNKVRNFIFEQEEDIDTDMGYGLETEEKPEEEKTKEYTVSGGKIIVHGVTEQDLTLTEEEKQTYQETMEQFVEEVSDMAEFHALHIYKNNVEWSGDLLKFDVRFYYSISEVEGTYIGNNNMIKIDNEFMGVLTSVKDFYKTFESKWAKVLANRRTTELERESGLGDNELSVDVETDSDIE